MKFCCGFRLQTAGLFFFCKSAFGLVGFFTQERVLSLNGVCLFLVSSSVLLRSLCLGMVLSIVQWI